MYHHAHAGSNKLLSWFVDAKSDVNQGMGYIRFPYRKEEA